jgi:putative transposase
MERNMKKNLFSEAQIVAILRQQQNGQTVVQITLEHGISEATFTTARRPLASAIWRYGGF